MRLTDNTIVITGGTSGIGRALAENFHQRSNQVIITGRRQQLLDEITAAHPGMQGIALDLDDAGATAEFARGIRERFPGLNVLINNAGISRMEDLSADSMAITESEAMIETNILSVLRLTAALLPTLRKNPDATIITTTSGLAFVPLANFPTYCATKAFLHSWLQSLRFQLRETGVQVLELAPPYVQTELGGESQAHDPAAMPLAEYVAEVMQLLRDPKPPQGEILVERVKTLRFAESSGNYDQVFVGLNSALDGA